MSHRVLNAEEIGRVIAALVETGHIPRARQLDAGHDAAIQVTKWELAAARREREAAAPPQLGQLVTVRGVRCKIFKIHPLGTIDVEEIDGPRAFRLSGLHQIEIEK